VARGKCGVFSFIYIAVWVSHLLSYTRVFLVAVIFSLLHVRPTL